MPICLPPLVTGVINGDEDAWSRACSLLGAYYQPDRTRRSAVDLIVNGDPYADDAVLSGVDLAALAAAGITINAATQEALLSDDYLAELVYQIPVDVELVDAEENVIGDGSPAATAWAYLSGEDGYDLGWKCAEAILARLRPRLFPLLTGRVRKVLDLPKDMPTAWLEMRECLRDADARLSYQLYYLIETAPIWSELSQVQVLTSLVYADLGPKKPKKTASEAEPGPKTNARWGLITTDAVRLR